MTDAGETRTFFEGSRSTPTRASRVNDFASALRLHRDTNARVLEKVFELNAASAPLFSNVTSLIQALQPFMQGLAEVTDNLDLSEDVFAQLREIQHDFETLRIDHFPAFESGQDTYDNIEQDIIQSLLRSGRYLDRFFKPGLDNASVTLSPQPTVISTDSNVQIGDHMMERSISVIQYLSQMGDIEAIQEKLTDLDLEREQLLQEQRSRARFGLSLDDESLEFLSSCEQQGKLLSEELAYAKIVLEALRQVVNDKEALRITNEAITSNLDESSDSPMTIRESSMTITDSSSTIPDPSMTISTPATLASPFDETVAEEDQEQLLVQIRHDNTGFATYLDEKNSGPVDPTTLINIWMLDRICNHPGLLAKFIQSLGRHPRAFDTDYMQSLFMEAWAHRSTTAEVEEFRTTTDINSNKANRSTTQSAEKAEIEKLKLTPISQPQSLLQLGPRVTAMEIMEHARRARSTEQSNTSTMKSVD